MNKIILQIENQFGDIVIKLNYPQISETILSLKSFVELITYIGLEHGYEVYLNDEQTIITIQPCDYEGENERDKVLKMINEFNKRFI